MNKRANTKENKKKHNNARNRNTNITINTLRKLWKHKQKTTPQT